eukprot:gene13737-16236_t
MGDRAMFTSILLGLMLFSGSVFSAELDREKLEENEDAQIDKEEPTEEVVSQIVEQADPMELQSGVGDVSTTGDCKDDLDTFCKDVTPGEGRLSECLTNQQADDEKGVASPTGKKLSQPCVEELRDFKMERSTNINLDVMLAEACKSDAAKFCNDSNLYPEPGAVLTCLREVEEKLSSDCKAEVHRTKKEAAKDFALDAMLVELCEDDAKTLCPDVKPGGGRTQQCLREKRNSLSWDCQEELFRKEVEDADDIRLNIVLFRLCSRDKKKFCSDVKPGFGRAKQCLEDKRNEPDFSPECKAQFEKMMVRRASDFRLDTQLRDLCREDIEDVCGYEKDSLDSIAGYDGRVIECLQDYKDELVAPTCKDRVHKLTERSGEDIRMDRPLADACFEDRKRLCAGVAPGSARVLRCLQDSREQLTYECRATLFDQEVRLAEDIDFKFPMKKACNKEIELFCKDVPHGHARIISCLQSHDEDKEMGPECKAEVKRDEVRTAEDYRLNYRLNKECDMEIDNLCADVCSPFQGQACGGTVLKCLRDHQENITSDNCKKELFSVEKKQGNDYRTDAVLKESCVEDVEKFCVDVEPGNGRVHSCLLKHRSELTPACSKAEASLNEVQSSDVRLRPGFKACGEEMSVYCKSVKPGKGRMFRCLQSNMVKTDFSEKCKQQIEKKQGRMASNWKMDYGVAHNCKKDVESICRSEKGGHAGAVLKCLAENHAMLGKPECSYEVSRAARMALWQYRKGAAMTQVCDDDVSAFCTKLPSGKTIRSVGVVGNCLSANLLNLTVGCKKLVDIAAPADVAKEFNSGFASISLMKKISELGGTSAPLINTDQSGVAMVTVTGWVALACIAALVVVIFGGAYYGYRKVTGQDKPYTLVLKGGDM